MRRVLLPVDARNLVRRAAAHSGVSEFTLLSPSRVPALVQARYGVMLALRSKGWSYPRIAKALGRSDHTTAIHGVTVARKLRCTSPAFAELLDRLECGPPEAAPATFPYTDHRNMAEVMAAGE